MSKKSVVVSLGHDALGYTTTEQWDAVKVTAKALRLGLLASSFYAVSYDVQVIVSDCYNLFHNSNFVNGY